MTLQSVWLTLCDFKERKMAGRSFSRFVALQFCVGYFFYTLQGKTQLGFHFLVAGVILFLQGLMFVMLSIISYHPALFSTSSDPSLLFSAVISSIRSLSLYCQVYILSPCCQVCRQHWETAPYRIKAFSLGLCLSIIIDWFDRIGCSCISMTVFVK